MEEVHQHVVRGSGKVLAHQRNPTHDFGEFVHRHADEIELAWNGTVVWVVSVTKSAAECERAIVREVVVYYAQGLSLRGAEYVNVS
jgi:hypothetical protein